jgi:hypothetical protein
MCVLCYTVGSGLGEAVLFGGPFAFTVARKVRARITAAAAGATQPVAAAASEPAVEEPLRPSPPLARAPAPASA